MLAQRLKDDESGISLIEMMIAVLVMGMILTALAGSLVASLRNVVGQEAALKANALANQLVEDARALEFEHAALCETEALAVFGAASFESEPLVLLPDGDPQCSETDRLLPRQTGTRDGIDYVATYAVTWMDDAGDDVSGVDPDSPQDVKRLVVDLEWTVDGNARTMRTVSYRSPTPGEQLLISNVDPDITYIKDADETSTAIGQPRTSFTLSIESETEQQSVSVVFADRGGTEITPQYLTTSDGGYTWSLQIGPSLANFRNGETLFTFTATEPDGDVTEVIDRGLFLHDLEFRSTALPAVIEVLPSGAACPFRVEASIQGMLLSDGLDVLWAVRDPEIDAAVTLNDDVAGASFYRNYDGETYWADTTITSASVQFRAQRVADLASVTTTAVSIPIARVDACTV